jgi:NADH dehydrogenase
MRIVILGAGYAGLRAALDLAEARAETPQIKQVVLVDRNDYHQVVTWLHQVAAAAMEPERARLPLRKVLPKQGLNVLQAEVTGLKLANNRVVTSAGELEYDRLLIALGSETLWPDIPGLREHAWPLRWWPEAVALRKHIAQQYQQAAATTDQAERRRLMTIAVVGGGYTGIQLAGELAHWTPELADQHKLPITAIRLLLIEARDRLLPEGDAEMAAKAAQILQRKGVEVRLAAPLKQVEADQITVDGQPIPLGTLVWAGGVRPAQLLADAGLPTERGRIKVNKFLQVEDHPSIFVAGDSSLYYDEGKPLPATAAHALRQGGYVADVLLAQAQGKSFDPYEPTKLGILVAVGGLDAVGDALGVPLTGLPAGLLKEGVERWYLTTIGAYP